MTGLKRRATSSDRSCADRPLRPDSGASAEIEDRPVPSGRLTGQRKHFALQRQQLRRLLTKRISPAFLNGPQRLASLKPKRRSLSSHCTKHCVCRDRGLSWRHGIFEDRSLLIRHLIDAFAAVPGMRSQRKRRETLDRIFAVTRDDEYFDKPAAGVPFRKAALAASAEGFGHG